MQKQNNRERQWTILNLIQWTASYFKSHQIENPRADAEILLAHALDLERIDLYLRYDQPLHPGELSRFKYLIKKRIQREPIAYITGTKEFWALDFRITTDVLIPRPETECLVEKALAGLSDDIPMTVLELGTGSGAVTIALASENPKHRFIASDRSLSAVQIAAENADHHHLKRFISFVAGDWFHCFSQREAFDMIISNPPYIRSDEINHLEPEIFQYEPRMSLDGGADGLRCIEQIIIRAHHFLKPKGKLLLEMGYDQRADIQAILNSVNRYGGISYYKDYSGHDRGVMVEKKS
jgi:release factor glutamine methyltransferase